MIIFHLRSSIRLLVQQRNENYFGFYVEELYLEEWVSLV